jgi:general secretion pathway protein K
MAGHRRGPYVVGAVRPSSGERGFALLVVLLVLGFLALLGTQIVATARSNTQLAANLKQNAVLEAAADGAVVRAAFMIGALRDPAVRPDGMPHSLMVGSVPVVVTVRREDDRINLNTASASLLRAFLIEAGAPPASAIRIAAAILDWRTNGDTPRAEGAKAPQYRGAGLSYGPPGAPFQSVEELRLVLGITPALYDRMAPHLTVLSDDDPDSTTLDPVVARTLADAAGTDDSLTAAPTGRSDTALRITATAVGPSDTRYSIMEVVEGLFQSPSPEVRILLRQRCFRSVTGEIAADCN